MGGSCPLALVVAVTCSLAEVPPGLGEGGAPHGRRATRSLGHQADGGRHEPLHPRGETFHMEEALVSRERNAGLLWKGTCHLCPGARGTGWMWSEQGKAPWSFLEAVAPAIRGTWSSFQELRECQSHKGSEHHKTGLNLTPASLSHPQGSPMLQPAPLPCSGPHITRRQCFGDV